MSHGESRILSYSGKSLQVLTMTSATSTGLDSPQSQLGLQLTFITDPSLGLIFKNSGRARSSNDCWVFFCLGFFLIIVIILTPSTNMFILCCRTGAAFSGTEACMPCSLLLPTLLLLEDALCSHGLLPAQHCAEERLAKLKNPRTAALFAEK